MVLGSKPLPVTATDVPVGPDCGLRAIEGKTLNAVVALPPALSIALMAWSPATDSGTVNVAENDPAALDVMAGGLVVSAAPPYVSVMPELAAKPAPVTVACVPTGPEGGFTVSDGEVVNV